MDNKRFFYIFLDIKGVLYTADWIKFIQASGLSDDIQYKAELDRLLAEHPDWKEFYDKGGYNRPKNVRKICPYNMMSLNRLIEDLQYDYNVNLVITSTKWKEYFDLKTLPALVKNGLQYKDIVIDKTPIINEDKTFEIRKYLTQVRNTEDYVILDSDERLLNEFDNEKVILVDKHHSGLTDELVDNYLDMMSEKQDELVNDSVMFDIDETEIIGAV
ncbi:MAG: hypothetical protein IJA61_03920 [Clostridia bacterium]|nr:hypothetical protein [Clostridia bacterium]